LKKLGASGCDLLVIYGIGAVGLASLVMAKAMGATVIGVEKNQYRIDFAKKLGCDYTINGEKDDIYGQLMKICGDRGVPLSLETSGSNVLRKVAAKAAAIHGKLVMVGFDGDTKNDKIELLSTFDTRYIIRKELQILGSYVMPLGMYEELKEFLVRKKVHLDSIVTHRFPLIRFQDAVDLFYTGNAGKIIITME
jgi:propanol-preferring alcohol dehydrogenase